jgi:hypothetical protein
MAAVDFDALADVIKTTLDDLPKGQYEVMWDEQWYEFCGVYNESRRAVDGGKAIVRNVVLDETGSATYRRPFQTDEPSVDSIHEQITVPWTQLGTSYSWDMSEILMNKRSAKGFIDMIESRKVERLWGFANKLEERGWKAPVSATDKTNPYGIPYYLNMLDAGSTSAGFNGQTIRYTDGSTGTSCAGLDASTNAKWKNYAATYNQVDLGLLKVLRTACLLTYFRPPTGVGLRPPGNDKLGSNTKIYVNSSVAIEMQTLADARDDNTAPTDLAGKMITPSNDVKYVCYFNRRPVVYVSSLNGVTYSPIYCVDWSKIIPVTLENGWMLESKVHNHGLQHTAFTVYVDAWHNNLCVNRRTAGFVVHTPIPA